MGSITPTSAIFPFAQSDGGPLSAIRAIRNVILNSELKAKMHDAYLAVIINILYQFINSNLAAEGIAAKSLVNAWRDKPWENSGHMKFIWNRLRKPNLKDLEEAKK